MKLKQILPDHRYTYAGFTYTGQQVLDGEIDWLAILSMRGGCTVADDLLEALDDDGQAFAMVAKEAI